MSTVDVTVNVDPELYLSSYKYRYNTGDFDVDGLKAIGWNDDSIGYYVFNALNYPWKNNNYTVSDGNKALYGVVNKSNVSSYASNPDFIFCPYFDTAGMTNMKYMFQGFTSLQSIPELDMSKVTDAYGMFYNCSSLQTIPPLDTSSVNIMQYMFSDCSSLLTIPPLNIPFVTRMDSMFSNCTNLRIVPRLDTSYATRMDYMFSGCTSLQTIELLDMSNVGVTISMFNDCTNLSYIRLKGKLNVGLIISQTTLLDYDSVKSILTAASKTTDTKSKNLNFNSTQTDQNGELANLVSTCTSKGWTVSGLTLN